MSYCLMIRDQAGFESARRRGRLFHALSWATWAAFLFGGGMVTGCKKDAAAADSSPKSVEVRKASTTASAHKTLSEAYPGDVGMDKDPAVVWMESFESKSVDAVVKRYNDHKNPPGMALVPDVHPKSSGKAAMKMTAGGGQPEATDLFKNFGDGYDEWYVRWYVKYDPKAKYHHAGVWFGGYNPPINWPNPRAGQRPKGDDFVSFAVEPVAPVDPVGDERFLEFYNYWMRMHSYSKAGEAFWGNTLVHSKRTRVDDRWRCIEVHVRLNSDMSSSKDAELSLWINDEHIQTFNESKGHGYWLADHFCTRTADVKTCTDYPPEPGRKMIPLDLQFRNDDDLRLNHFWPEIYTGEDQPTTIWLDDIVIATRRIGCVK